MLDEKDVEPSPEEANTFDRWVHGLTDEQFAAVKATVNAVAEQRQQPTYSAMSDNEFREEVSKRFGFSPGV